MEVANLLMGPAGSKVRLRFLRQEGTGSCYKGAWLDCDCFCVLFVCVLLCSGEAVSLMDSLFHPLRVLSSPPAVSASWNFQCASGVFSCCLGVTSSSSLCRLYASEGALRGCLMRDGQACAGDVLVTLRTWGDARSLKSCHGRSTRDETTVRSVLGVLWTPRINYTQAAPCGLFAEHHTFLSSCRRGPRPARAGCRVVDALACLNTDFMFSRGTTRSPTRRRCFSSIAADSPVNAARTFL